MFGIYSFHEVEGNNKYDMRYLKSLAQLLHTGAEEGSWSNLLEFTSP